MTSAVIAFEVALAERGLAALAAGQSTARVALGRRLGST